MSLVANIIYLVLPIVSGSWVPISMFLSGFRASLSGHLSIMSMNWSFNFAINGKFSWKSLPFIVAYTAVATGLALFIKSQRESDHG